MKRKLALLAAGIVAAGVVSTATADPINVADTAYVVADGDDAGLWHETNGKAGLQTTETTNDDGSTTPADDKLAP